MQINENLMLELMQNHFVGLYILGSDSTSLEELQLRKTLLNRGAILILKKSRYWNFWNGIEKSNNDD